MIGICIFYVVLALILSASVAIYYDEPKLFIWIFVACVIVIAGIILFLYTIL